MSGWVYFIQEGTDGSIKIGHTQKSPTNRLNNLQHGNCRPLRIIGLVKGVLSDERAWHADFAAFRLEREWFSADPSLLAAIAARCITGDRLAGLVEHYRRGERRVGKRLRQLQTWMHETGRTPESLAAEIGWKEVLVRNAVYGRNNQAGLGMYLAAAVARVSGGRFTTGDLYSGGRSRVYDAILAKEAQRQAVSA